MTREIPLFIAHLRMKRLTLGFSGGAGAVHGVGQVVQGHGWYGGR